MFVLKKSHTFWWPATARVPADEGKIVEDDFMLLFETIEPEEARRIMEEVAAAERAGDTSKSHALLRRVVKGWKDVVAPDKTQVPFSDEVLVQALGFPWFSVAAYEAWADAQNGRERARKN
ncbi:MAG: hypothetical protein KF765_12215 [Parvibaculaceae bacterium]|nr:hypothetical protein [Parvibaculaceae bacterium]